MYRNQAWYDIRAHTETNKYRERIHTWKQIVVPEYFKIITTWNTALDCFLFLYLHLFIFDIGH